MRALPTLTVHAVQARTRFLIEQLHGLQTKEPNLPGFCTKLGTLRNTSASPLRPSPATGNTATRLATGTEARTVQSRKSMRSADDRAAFIAHVRLMTRPAKVTITALPRSPHAPAPVASAAIPAPRYDPQVSRLITQFNSDSAQRAKAKLPAAAVPAATRSVAHRSVCNQEQVPATSTRPVRPAPAPALNHTLAPLASPTLVSAAQSRITPFPQLPSSTPAESGANLVAAASTAGRDAGMPDALAPPNSAAPLVPREQRLQSISHALDACKARLDTLQRQFLRNELLPPSRSMAPYPVHTATGKLDSGRASPTVSSIPPPPTFEDAAELDVPRKLPTTSPGSGTSRHGRAPIQPSKSTQWHRSGLIT